MRLTEKELRRIAQHVVGMLPDDNGDCERVFELARELKQWEDQSAPADEKNGEPDRRSQLKLLRDYALRG